MKAEVLSEKKNAFLRRKELQVAIAHESEPTPAKAGLQEVLAKQLGESAEKIDVRNIYSDHGRSRSLSRVFIWEEPPKKVEKKKDQKAPEEKTEAKKEEKQKVVEEVKAE